MYYRKIQNFSFKTKKSNFFWTQINPKVAKAQYAVRGIIPQTAKKINQQIARHPVKNSFTQLTYCNNGNPQQFYQKPITFNRQVLSCLLNPSLILMKGINLDAAKRAQGYLKKIISAGSYSHSLGLPHVRTSISQYLAKNDMITQPQIQNIYLTEGATQGVNLILNTLITGPDDSVMVPIPQYPLYSAAISIYNGHECPYYLNEKTGWQLNREELDESLEKAKKQGKNVKAIVMINPGNPTGAVFTPQTIKKAIQFAIKHKIVIIADEVYRQNIYKQGQQFFSFRKVLQTMSQEQRSACQLVSINSISKGFLGQCGLRGGYLYLYNISPDVKQQIFKLKSIFLCSNIIGQTMIDLMCKPPIENVQEQTKNLYLSEVKALHTSLKRRAQLCTQMLRKMDNVSCSQVEGAMYAFPSVKLSKKAIQAAGDQEPDLFYCLQALKSTGILLTPGSSFHQKQGTYHFRMTTLALPQERLNQKLIQLTKFNDEFHKRHQ